jgi:drug/metabolite transporter (DMT)-like permease
VNLYWAGFALIVVSVVSYNIAQKFLPTHLNPFALLTVVYLVAGLVCFLFALFSSGKPEMTAISSAFTGINWTIWLLALAVVGIEVGYVIAFRAGWKASLLAITVQATALLALAPIGVLFFKEKLSILNWVGLALCLLGLVLVTQRQT